MKLSLRFLKGLEDAGAESAEDINAKRVMQACLSLKSDYYWEATHTFAHFLAEAGYWHCAAIPCVQEGLSKQVLAQAGLVSALDLYEHLHLCD